MPRPRKAPRRAGYQPGRHFSPGEGAIVPIKGGTRWRGAFRWQDPTTGERRRVWITGVDEADVKRRWEARRTELEAPPAAQAADRTLREYLATWLQSVVRVQRRTGTLERYADLAATISAELGSTLLAALDSRQIQRFYADLGRRGLSATTVRLTHTVLHSALEHARRTGLLAANPASGLVLPRRQRREYPTITPDQLRAALAYADASNDRLAALWTLIATTGLRRSEALGLRWQDVDLDRGVLTVRQQLVKTRTQGLQTTAPKSDRGRRPIRLMARALTALRAHRERMDVERAAAAPPWPASELVFVTRQGAGYNGKTIDTHWRRLLARAGLPHLRLHDLRHTLATLLLAQGEHPRLVQELLGHSQVSMTLDVYSHVLPSLHGAAMERLERFLWPESAAEVAQEVAQDGLAG